MVGFSDRLYGGYENLLGFTDKTHATGRIQRAEWYGGNIAMHVDGVWHFLQLKSTAPEKEYGVALMPYNSKNPKAKHRNFAMGGWCYSIPKGAKNPDAAWEWLKYSCAGEGNLNFFKAQTRPSPVKKHNEDPYFAQNNPFWSIVQESLAASDRAVATPVQAEINKAIVQMTEEALLHKKSPEDAQKAAAETAQKAIDDFWANQ
jgi:multiple sugar transport system substrate-binding protein